MSCGGGKPNFRLLDSYVGWEAPSTDGLNLIGFRDPAGLRLEQDDPNAVNPADVTGRLFPARLVKGCGACEWFLLTPAKPVSGLLRRDACHLEWHPLWSRRVGAEIVDGVALAAWRGYLAFADRGAGSVQVWTRDGARRVAAIPIVEPGPITFTGKGELLITKSAETRIARYGLDGRFRGWWKAPLQGIPNRLAMDAQHRLWVVVISPENSWELWRAGDKDTAFAPASIRELQAAFPPTGIAAESDAGFCFDQPNDSGFESSTCFSWCGKSLDGCAIQPAPPPHRKVKGQLLTNALDSGIPRCRWHRIRLDADLPPLTSLEIAVATTEEIPAQGQGDPSRETGWTSFPAGAPHPMDWTVLTDSLDSLIDQPPGRFLYFRLRFTGNGIVTPVVRRARIDFPRVTSLEHLPEVYRENPQAEDFTERFLSLFDSSMEDLDRIIERYPALLDPTGVPQQLLPWLAGFFDIGLDPTWDEAKRRKILQAAPKLYRLRGTREGLQEAIEAVFGVTPAIEELSATGSWGAVGSPELIRCTQAKKTTPPPSVRRTARLGRVRLFGMKRVRFRVGRSSLGKAPLRSYGNPDQDPFAAGAYQFRLLLPPLPNDSKEERARLLNLINAQKPAHTVASVRVGGTGFLIGFSSAVGVDTVFTPLARPRLGATGNVRLNRNTILWHGAPAGSRGISVGRSSNVGIQTIAG
jgi:phage tail-like protein